MSLNNKNKKELKREYNCYDKEKDCFFVYLLSKHGEYLTIPYSRWEEYNNDMKQRIERAYNERETIRKIACALSLDYINYFPECPHIIYDEQEKQKPVYRNLIKLFPEVFKIWIDEPNKTVHLTFTERENTLYISDFSDTNAHLKKNYTFKSLDKY